MDVSMQGAGFDLTVQVQLQLSSNCALKGKMAGRKAWRQKFCWHVFITCPDGANRSFGGQCGSVLSALWSKIQEIQKPGFRLVPWTTIMPKDEKKIVHALFMSNGEGARVRDGTRDEKKPAFLLEDALCVK